MPMINNVISTTPDYLQGYVGGYPVNIPVGLLIPAVVQKGVVNGNQPVSYNPSTSLFSAAGATLAIGAASIQTGALTASTTQAPNATAVQTALSGYAAFGHVHSIAGVSGLQTLLDSLQAQISALAAYIVTAYAFTLDGTNVLTLDGVLELTI